MLFGFYWNPPERSPVERQLVDPKPGLKVEIQSPSFLDEGQIMDVTDQDDGTKELVIHTYRDEIGSEINDVSIRVLEEAR